MKSIRINAVEGWGAAVDIFSQNTHWTTSSVVPTLDDGLKDFQYSSILQFLEGSDNQ